MVTPRCSGSFPPAVYSQLSRRDADSAAYDARRWAFLQSKGPSRTAPLQGSTSFGPRDRSADGSGSYQTRNASRSDELAYHRTVSGDNQGYSPSSVNPLDFKPSHRAVGRVVPSGSGTDQAVWSQGSFSSPWGVSSGSVLGPVSQAGSTPTYVFPQGYGPHAFPVAANAWRTPGSLVPVQSSFAQQPFPPTEGVGPNDIASLSQLPVPQVGFLAQMPSSQAGHPYSHASAALAQTALSSSVPSHSTSSHVGFVSTPGLRYPSGAYGSVQGDLGTSTSGAGSAPGQTLVPQVGFAAVPEAGFSFNRGHMGSLELGSQFGHHYYHVASAPWPAAGVGAAPVNTLTAVSSGVASMPHGPHLPAHVAGATPGQTVLHGRSLHDYTNAAVTHVAQGPPHFMHGLGVHEVDSIQGAYRARQPLPLQTISTPTLRKVPAELCLCLKDFALQSRL
ncbi:hypothetical protein GN956_G24158 [Arapaima gigas]